MIHLYQIKYLSNICREQRRARLEGKQDWEVEVDPSSILKEAYIKEAYLKETY